MSYFRFGALSPGDVTAASQAFAAADPFPHVVITDVITVPPQSVLRHFPSCNSSEWLRATESYQMAKMTFSRLERLPEPFLSMLCELSAPPFLQFLEKLSGIPGLIPDPYLQGAGLHRSGVGGVMAPHTDTHIHQRLGLFKRVNVVIYLNPDWSEEYGGCLELYDSRDPVTPVRTIVPRWGTCVIFRTDTRSVHGFSQPIVGRERVRRAVVAYYYTSSDTLAFSGDLMTHWWEHGNYWERSHGGMLGRCARMYLYRSLRIGATGLAYLAHRARPVAVPPVPR